MGWRDDDEREFDYRPRRRRLRKKTGSPLLGIAALAIGVLSVIAVFILIVAIAAIDVAKRGQVNDNDPEMILVGLGFIGTLLLTVVGVVLGSVGAFGSNTTGMVCSIVGAVVNVLVLFGVLSIMCLGLIVGPN